MLPINFLVAVLGGALSLLPACGPALLPGFFGLAFTVKGQLLKAVLFFALGFSLIFLPFSLGIIALLNALVSSRESIFVFVGWCLILFGLWNFIEYRPALAVPDVIVTELRKLQTFGLGIVFGLTSSSCTAPIYGAIISFASISENMLSALALLLAFEFGMFLPLFLLAYFFSRSRGLLIRLAKPIWSFGDRIKVNISFGSLLSGIIFIILGVTFVTIKGTPFTVFAETSGLLDLFYRLNESLLD